MALGRLARFPISLAILISALRVSIEPSSAQDESLAVDPQAIFANEATVTTATIRLSDPLLIRSSVRLERLDATGRIMGILGPFNDSGRERDVTPFDEVFTAHVNLIVHAPELLFVRASWTLIGSETRVLSNTVSIAVIQGAVIGNDGGVVVGADQSQLTIPAGALREDTPVGIREMSLEEVQYVLRRKFSAQGLTFVGAVEVSTRGVTLSLPAHMSIPDTLDIPAGSQVLVAHVVSDIDGDHEPDLVLVDSATVSDGRLETDELLGSLGVVKPGAYVFLKSTSPLSLLAGTVMTQSGRPVAAAPVISIDAPDLLAQTDSLGSFMVAVPADIDPTPIVAASRKRSVFGFILASPNGGAIASELTSTAALGAASPITLDLKKSALSELLKDYPCKGVSTSSEKAKKALQKQLRKQMESALSSSHIDLALSPQSISVDETSVALADVAGFLAKANQKNVSFKIEPPIPLPGPFGTSGIELTHGIASAEVTGVHIGLIASAPKVASVLGDGIPVANGVLKWLVQGKQPGVTRILGSAANVAFKEQLKLSVKAKDGEFCPDIELATNGTASAPVAVGPATLTVVDDTLRLTVVREGAGSGTVTQTADRQASPCGTGCRRYPKDTHVTLQAHPDAKSVFVQWKGCDVVADATCTVTMTDDRTLTAKFGPLTAPLLSPLSIDVTATCTAVQTNPPPLPPSCLTWTSAPWTQTLSGIATNTSWFILHEAPPPPSTDCAPSTESLFGTGPATLTFTVSCPPVKTTVLYFLSTQRAGELNPTQMYRCDGTVTPDDFAVRLAGALEVRCSGLTSSVAAVRR